MSNYCHFNLRAVSENKSALTRLLTIMNYKDYEFFVHTVFNADKDNENMIQTPDGKNLFSMDITGTVAWSCNRWFDWKEDFDKHATLGFEMDENGNDDYDNPIKSLAHYIPLDILCEKLGIAIEIYSCESGFCFQEHIIISPKGIVTKNERVKWLPDYLADLGEILPNPNGFEDYGQFLEEPDIYNQSRPSFMKILN